MSRPLHVLREKVWKSLRRLERLHDLDAPELILARERALLERHLSRLGDAADHTLREYPARRLEVLGQEAAMRAWETRCEGCLHKNRDALEVAQASAEPGWCRNYREDERPAPAECSLFTSRWQN